MSEGRRARAACWRATVVIAGLALGTASLGFASPAAALVELVGATSATFEWTPATGPVAGYVAVVTRNDALSFEIHWVEGTNRVTIAGEYGDEIQVRTFAYAGSRQRPRFGQPSPVSEEVRFVAPPPPPPADYHDFDGDGDADLALHCASCPDLLLFELEEGEVVDPSRLAPVPGEGWVLGGTADYDGNGFADLLWNELETGHVAILLMANFEPTGWITSEDPELAARRLIASADFDGDTVPELALRNLENGAVEIWGVEGQELVRRDVIGGYSLRKWTVAGAADFDGDALADLLWLRSYPRELQIWFMEGGNLQDRENLGREVSWTYEVQGVADYDGDGRQDVLWRNTKNDQLIVWFRDAQGHEEQRLPIADADKTSDVVASLDLDGDDAAEILLQDRDTGEIVSASAVAEDPAERRTVSSPDLPWRVSNVGAEHPDAVD